MLDQILNRQGESASRKSARSNRAVQYQRQLRWWKVCLATALCVGPLMFTIGWFARGNQSTDNPAIGVETCNSPLGHHQVTEMVTRPGDVKVKASDSSLEDLHRVAKINGNPGDVEVETSNSSPEDLNLPGLQSFNSSLESDYIANVNMVQSVVDSCEPICKPESIFTGFIDGVPGLGNKYHPDHGIVCRCPTHSGCGSSDEHTCKPVETKWVEAVYKVTHQDGTYSLERFRWLIQNVTRCACLPDEDGLK